MYLLFENKLELQGTTSLDKLFVFECELIDKTLYSYDTAVLNG